MLIRFHLVSIAILEKYVHGFADSYIKTLISYSQNIKRVIAEQQKIDGSIWTSLRLDNKKYHRLNNHQDL